MQVKSKTRKTEVRKVKEPLKTISKREQYPMPICLERCDLTITNGFHDEVLKVLKSFSNKNDHEARHPHQLHKDGKLKDIQSKANGNSVKSIDIKGQNGRGNKRLFYYTERIEESVTICKVLALCSEDSHHN